MAHELEFMSHVDQRLTHCDMTMVCTAQQGQQAHETDTLATRLNQIFLVAGMTLLGYATGKETSGTWLKGRKDVRTYLKRRREGLLDTNGVGEGSRGNSQAHSDLHLG